MHGRRLAGPMATQGTSCPVTVLFAQGFSFSLRFWLGQNEIVFIVIEFRLENFLVEVGLELVDFEMVYNLLQNFGVSKLGIIFDSVGDIAIR